MIVLPPKIDAGNLKGQIPVVEAIGCPASNFTHTDLADPSLTKSRHFLDRAYHHNDIHLCKPGSHWTRSDPPSGDDITMIAAL